MSGSDSVKQVAFKGQIRPSGIVFISVTIGLYVIVAAVIYITIQALPPSPTHTALEKLTSRVVTVEHHSALHVHHNPKPVTGDLQELKFELQLLREKLRELDDRATSQAGRIEEQLSEVDTSTKWQIATLWGVILALAAAIVPVVLARR